MSVQGTVDLLFDWFGISCRTTDNFCFYLQNRLTQTGGQQYSGTSPFSVPWSVGHFPVGSDDVIWSSDDASLTTVQRLVIRHYAVMLSVVAPASVDQDLESHKSAAKKCGKL